jgi:catalase
LNRTVDEFFSEVEQAAFCTSRVVPGIGFNDDPLLQGRNFSYLTLKLLGLVSIGNRCVRHEQTATVSDLDVLQLPINCPVCPALNHHRGGSSQHRIHKGQINYWPNRDGVGHPVPAKEGGYTESVCDVMALINTHPSLQSPDTCFRD